ncbi:hypothetical protein ACUZ9N_01735 [Mycoplasmopsis gallinarum]
MKKIKNFLKIASISGMTLIPVVFVASCENSKQKEAKSLFEEFETLVNELGGDAAAPYMTMLSTAKENIKNASNEELDLIIGQLKTQIALLKNLKTSMASSNTN